MPEKVEVEEGSNSPADDSNKHLPPTDEEIGDSEKAPGCSAQKDEISPQLHKRLEKGDLWYLLDVRWFKLWKKYVGFEAWDQAQMGADSAHPGPVDTSALFKADLMKVMKETFSVPEEKECRVWHKYMLSTYDLLSKLDESIQDAGLYTNQLLLLEQKKDDGTWPRETTTYTGANMSSVRSSDVGGASTGHGTSSSMSSSVGSSMRSTTSGMSSSSYWGYDQPSEPGVCGLSNLGNTCFMNSALQCLSNTYTLTDYFLKDAYRKHINEKNPLGMGGNLAKAYGSLLHEMWSGKTSYTHPRNLKATIGKFAPQFVGYAQHDSQELLAFLLDGLHEDLNQVKKKPYVDMDIKSEGRSDKEIAEEAWKKYLMRNKSVVVMLFQGQLKSTLVCPDCKKVSRIFDPFMYMSLPMPIKKTRELVIYLVKNDPTQRIEKVKITVPKHGQISALTAEVSKQTGVNKDRMVVIDVYNCRFHKIFDNRENISLIMDRDDIYCYEVHVTSAQDPNFTVIPVYNREKVVRTVNYTYGSSYTSTYHQLFGVPQLITVPRDGLTYRTLYGILIDHMRRYVKKQTKAKPDKITEPSEAGYDEVDKQAGNANNDTMDTGENNNDNNKPEDDNTEAKMEEGKEKNSDDEKEEEEKKAAKPEDYFTMSIVNGYGSQVLRNLVDDDAPLKLNNNTYVACDWDSSWKEECYDLAEAEFKIHHSSMNQSHAEEKKKNINLLDCVKLFTVEEQLGEEDPWYCPNCKEHKQAFKKFDLWKLPEILVIHLKRFTYNRYWRDKLDVLVDFPVHALDLSSEMINPDEPEPIYDLYAVANHYGGMGGGHYTAYGKNANGKWYHFDDSHVSETDENHVVTSAAYVLFYKRRVGGQPQLLRRMSSYTHREPSQDEPDKKEKTSSSANNDMDTSNDTDNGAGAAAAATEAESRDENNSSATDDVFNNKMDS
ncbi:ubiquitin carboxyl-terminal hydrolase 4-like isoform X2 [Dysidea avara]|uniref:ubiquitin carboxyl-terminal hydrolase 4-like isoform X2 n=1 Tax=Dysidea avara TaxID=196820 RepID=UPI00332F4F72